MDWPLRNKEPRAVHPPLTFSNWAQPETESLEGDQGGSKDWVLQVPHPHLSHLPLDSDLDAFLSGITIT